MTLCIVTLSFAPALACMRAPAGGAGRSKASHTCYPESLTKTGTARLAADSPISSTAEDRRMTSSIHKLSCAAALACIPPPACAVHCPKTVKHASQGSLTKTSTSCAFWRTQISTAGDRCITSYIDTLSSAAALACMDTSEGGAGRSKASHKCYPESLTKTGTARLAALHKFVQLQRIGK